MSFPNPIVSTDVPVMVIADPPESQRGPERDSPQQRVRRRLRPLYVAALFQGAVLWVPIEKLFLNEIGFDSAKVGVMAAAYAAAVPFLEIPSGILADRWSRRGVLILANIALMLASAIGGASNSFANYLVSAVMLGVFFAMQSGTLDSIIYDTVLEETGDSEGFEATVGRLRLLESAALVTSALLGGWIAELTSPRATYFLTVPIVALAIPLLARLREPVLHKPEESIPLRTQIRTTYRTILARGSLLPVIVAMVLSSLLLQALLEFGPLWMVALAAPTVLFGPHWAGLMSALGLGGVLASRLRLTDRPTVSAVASLMVAASLVLTAAGSPIVVILAQAVLALLLVLVGIFLTRQLHDAIPSTIRAGVASGVGTLTWMAFLPFALTFGVASERMGVDDAGWMIVGVTVATCASVMRLAWTPRGMASNLSLRPLGLLRRGRSRRAE
jgi:MFS family permease